MASPPQVRSGVKLTRYVDPLPIPPVIRSTGKPGDVIEVQMNEFRQKLHRDLPPTMVWGYNGTWPGPTVEARSGEPTNIKWVTNLPARHWAEPGHYLLRAHYQDRLRLQYKCA
jgi:spore coat protein A